MGGVRRVLVGLGLCAAVAACSTEPATDVGPQAATLNATGVTGAQPVSYRFEYATDANDLAAGRSTTTPVAVTLPPRSAVTPFHLRVDGLRPSTTYHYRTCGTSPGDARPTCFGYQSFRTGSTACADDGDGCSTDRATEVNARKATLQASGFSRTRAVVHWFEVRRDDDALVLKTPERGPDTLDDGTFSETVTAAAVAGGGAYGTTFRACARVPGDPATCAPFTWLRFATLNCAAAESWPCTVEGPTGITDTTAVLLASNFSHDEPLTHWFELTGGDGTVSTPKRGPDVLGDGTFQETATGLKPGATYTVMACGQAADAEAPTCSTENPSFTMTSPFGRVCVRPGTCDLATRDVTATTATFRASGLTPDRAYRVWFLVAPAWAHIDDPDATGVIRTPEQTVDASTTEVTATVTGLAPGFELYESRICVGTTDGSVSSCDFGTPAFHTRSGPPGDYARHGGRVSVRAHGDYAYAGGYVEGTVTWDIDVSAAADGTGVTGHASEVKDWSVLDPPVQTTTGRVSCVNVIGPDAVINVVRPDDGLRTFFVHGATGEDGDTQDRVRVYDALRDSPTDCSPEKGTNWDWFPEAEGDVEVEQAP